MPRPTPAADVAAANQYLGGMGKKRRPAWITASPSVAPSPRTKRTYDQRTFEQAPPPAPPSRSLPLADNLPQARPAGPNVLPSPAPSDEPSPMAAIPHDSANQSPPSDEPPPQSMEEPGPAADASHVAPMAEPTTCAPASSVALDDQTQDIGHGSPPRPEPVFALDAPGSQSPPAATDAPDTSPASEWAPYVPLHPPPRPSMSPRVVSANTASTTSLAPRTPGQSPQAQAGNLPKRRRIGSGTSLGESANAKETGFAAKLPQMCNDCNRQRMALVSEAHSKNDVDFLHIHQTYCAWTRGDLEPLTNERGIPKPTIDKAFGILQDILRSNHLLQREILEYFVTHPGPLEAAINDPWLNFVNNMARNYASLIILARSRQRPMLVGEMICFLGCRSVVMQKLLFTANRRNLGVREDLGLVARTMDDIFAQDQQTANSSPDFRAGDTSSYTWQHFESMNGGIVARYRACVTAASHPIPGQLGPQPSLPWQDPPTVRPPQFAQPPTAFGAAHQRPMPTATRPMQTQWQQSIRQASATTPVTEGLVGHGYATQAQRLPQTTGPVAQGSVYSNASRRQSSAPMAHSSVPAAQSFQSSLGFAAQSSPQSHDTYPVQTPIQHPHHQQLIQDYRRQSLPLLQGGYPIPPVPSNGHVPQPAPPLGFPSQLHGPAAQPRMPARQDVLSSNGNMQNRISQPPQRPPASVGPPSATIPRDRTRLLPPRGELIPRSEHAHNQYEEHSMHMTMHQIHLRSPVRTHRVLGDTRVPQERHYQFVDGFVVAPVVILSCSYIPAELSFNVDDETLSRLSKPVPQQGTEPQIPVYEYQEGTLRIRLRCCKIAGPTVDLSQSKWVNLESSWPAHIFMMLNENTALTPRRKSHYGKDLPVELTSDVVAGKNQIKIALSMPKAPVEYYAVAVEMVVTKSHSTLWNQIRNGQVLSPDKTLEVIRKRAGVNKDDDDDDDGIMIMTDELPIDLADPFSATIFETPVRGVNCTHLECFDLRNWLETRERKSARQCISHKANTCNETCRWRIAEPTLVDKWRCPITSCFGDARPCSLVVDGFLLEVRQKLESAGRLDARSILVSPDGSWKPVPDREENPNVNVNDDPGSDDDSKGKEAPGRQSRSTSRSGRAVSTGSVYPDVRALHALPEVIDLT